MSEGLPKHILGTEAKAVPEAVAEVKVENPPEIDKYSEERKILQTRMEKLGRILPEEHEFTQYVERIAERLGVPEETKFLVLDSEEWEAFYHPVSRTIGFSRGACLQLIELGLELAEDHVAAIVAHELAHADVLGDEYVKRLEEDYTSRFMAFQQHAEEYRADSQAMHRLSKASYNPKAIIDFLRTFPLTHGRGDAGHPENIDRIRKLEDRLADDEHPLSHTTKEPSAIEPDLLTYFVADSEIYTKTTELLKSSPEQARQALLEANNQAEFWSIYDVQEHIERIANAKEVIAQNPELLDRLVTKSMVYRAFTQFSRFLDGQPITFSSAVNNSLVSEDGGLTPAEGSQLTKISWSVESSELRKVVDSQPFRESVLRQATLPEGVAVAQSKLIKSEQLLDQAIQARFRFLETKELTETEQQFINELKRCYETGSVSTDLSLTLFSDYDLTLQTGRQQKALEEKRQQGLRDPEKSLIPLFDLRDQETRDRLFEQLKLGMAASIIELGEPTPEMIECFGRNIENDTGLSVEAARIIAETMLLGKSSEQWEAYLATQERTGLPEIISQAQKLKQEPTALFYSSIRKLHKAYRASGYEDSRSFAFDRKYLNVSDPGLPLIKTLPAWTLYLHGYPNRTPEIVEQLLSRNREKPQNVQLTLTEWNAVMEGHGFFGISQERDLAVIQMYLKLVELRAPIDKEMKRSLDEVMLHSTDALDVRRLGLLIEHSPWESGELQKRVSMALEKLPHELDDREERLATYHTLRSAYKVFHQSSVDRSKLGYGEYVIYDKSIASHMFDLLMQDVSETTGAERNECFVQAIKYLTQEGYNTSFASLSVKAKEALSELSDDQLEDLIIFFQQRPEADNDLRNLTESLVILSQIPSQERLEATKNIVSERTINHLIERHGEAAVTWVMQHLQPTYNRDVLVVGLIDFAPKELRPIFVEDSKGALAYSPDDYQARQSPNFDPELYIGFVKGREPRPENQVLFRGYGKLAENFDDFLTRRYAYDQLGHPTQRFLAQRNWQRNNDSNHYGSPYQRYQAERLTDAEPTLFDTTIPLVERIQALTEVAPFPSNVRDIHLELLLREELSRGESGQQKVETGRALLPLFREGSPLREGLGIQVLRAELSINPELINNYQDFLATLTFYLPDPSLARNHFLNELENAVPCTPDQLRAIEKMRVTSEGKSEKDEDAPGTFILNRLGELNRGERSKVILWLLGVSDEKPLAIQKAESEFDGHLNSLPAVVMGGTPTEKEVFFKRLLLGAEGVIDLESVDGESKETAKHLRHEFLKTLAASLVPENSSNPELGRKLFISVVESSDPSHASRLLIKLINRLSEARSDGKELSIEELAALGLTELGVIGKKVAQSLAELDWVPESFKEQLKKAQSEGEVVPKRALLSLAEDAGLLGANSPLRIISFDDLIGAASNKQGCMVTVEVTDPSVGLPVGRHQVVGKFKRPSAQKIENVEHDLAVLDNIVKMLSQEGFGGSLPRDFLEQISASVKRELDFGREKEFSDQIRVDVNARNARRRFKVTVPDIYFASDDLMIEQRAPGISLRQYSDRRTPDMGGFVPTYGKTAERAIHATVATEAIAQLISTGNIHADLHPGNIFVDEQGHVTLIDLGMHEKLNRQQRLDTIALITGLVTGNESYIKSTLRRFGWNLGEAKLNLERFKFADNTTVLLNATHQSETPPPETVTSIIIAASKLGTYTSGFSNKELARMLISTVDKREVPAIITNMIKAGGREFISGQNQDVTK